MELFRQNLFMLRDELFIQAAEGLVPFEHPAYGILRSQMNSHIRFAHKLSLFHVLLTVPNDSPHFNMMSKDREKHWQEAIKTVSPEQKKELLRFKNEMEGIVLGQLLWGTLTAKLFTSVMLVCLVAFGVYLLFKEKITDGSLWNRLRKAVQREFDRYTFRVEKTADFLSSNDRTILA